MNYDDIIRLPHHVSKNHPRMSRLDRAAQFAPFAALAGYGAAVAETARETEFRVDLGDDVQCELDRSFALLAAHADEHPVVTVTHFVPDARKAGGAYVMDTGALRKLSPDLRTLYLSDGPTIDIADITALRVDRDWTADG